MTGVGMEYQISDLAMYTYYGRYFVLGSRMVRVMSAQYMFNKWDQHAKKKDGMEYQISY